MTRLRSWTSPLWSSYSRGVCVDGAVRTAELQETNTIYLCRYNYQAIGVKAKSGLFSDELAQNTFKPSVKTHFRRAIVE
jgi:hypothetical protein